MGCCDLKTLSLIVAWLQTIFAVIGAIICVAFIFSMDSDVVRKTELYDLYGEAIIAIFIVLLIVCLVAFALGVTLIVGINQERHRLMAPYVYVACVGIVLGTIALVISFIMSLVNKQPFGDVFLDLIRNALSIAFQVLFLSPVYLLYKKMRSGPTQPEPGCTNNETLNKPNYLQGGHM